MFETIKKKAKEGKEWCVDHKRDFGDLGFYMLGATAAMVGMSIGRAIDEKNNSKKLNENFKNEIGVLKSKRFSDASYYCYSKDGISDLEVKDLSDRVASRPDMCPPDAKVVGALVYTKKQ